MTTKWLSAYAIWRQHNFHFTIIFLSQCGINFFVWVLYVLSGVTRKLIHDLTMLSFSDGSCENDPYQEGGGMGDYPPSPESWIGEGMENAPPGQGNNLGHSELILYPLQHH